MPITVSADKTVKLPFSYAGSFNTNWHQLAKVLTSFECTTFSRTKARLNWPLKAATLSSEMQYSKTCVKRPLKNRQNKDLNEKL